MIFFLIFRFVQVCLNCILVYVYTFNSRPIDLTLFTSNGQIIKSESCVILFDNYYDSDEQYNRLRLYYFFLH